MIKYGYTGKVLRVDLTRGKTFDEETGKTLPEQFVGGTGFGANYLYHEMKVDTHWDSPENRIIFAPGPLAGTKVGGSAAVSIVSKGPMTNLAGSSQSNGNFGAFLKYSGYDAIVIHGNSPEIVYLLIKDGKAELREAKRLKGKETFETEDEIRQELGEGRRYSIFTIGPAGEKRVKYAMLCCDKGHVASKNGLGAVMGSKNLKAVAAYHGDTKVIVSDERELNTLIKRLFEDARDSTGGEAFYKWGTNSSIDGARLHGELPVRNYTSSLFPQDPQINTKYIRTHYVIKPKPCWACRMRHCNRVTVKGGAYDGYEAEEPEYECVATWGPLIGNSDMGAVTMLSDLTDRLGMDVNEAGYVIAWVMECYEKDIVTRKQLDGIDMKWGHVEAVKEMLIKISNRDGIGDLLAEGVKRAAEQIGGEAINIGVYTMKGSTPRAHDHRSRWFELLDTCVSNTSTIEASGGSVPTERFGWPKIGNSFSPWEISTSNARINGWFVFLDSLVFCRFCGSNPELITSTLNAVTGWYLKPEDALKVGKRIINQLRMFNLLHGLNIETECPSPRYGSTPTDGPAQGKSIMTYWKWTVRNYYETMGWDKNGIPLPQTLNNLGLEDLAEDLVKIQQNNK